MNPFVLGAHLPWSSVSDGLELLFELELVPEIAVKGPQYDDLDQGQARGLARDFAARGIRPRIHAPFFDLNPGALDPLIRDATRLRFEQTLALAEQLGAAVVVIHPGVDKWRYPNLEQVWCDNAAELLAPLIERAARIDCRLALENIYEESPGNLVQLVNRLDSASFGHCFDIGHWQLFSRQPQDRWLDALGDKLIHLHLHDNHGRADEHLPPGAGCIDFKPLLKQIARLRQAPTITLEAHSKEHLRASHRVALALFA
jgi:sugar phosphate isomerase/epimerase